MAYLTSATTPTDNIATILFFELSRVEDANAIGLINEISPGEVIEVTTAFDPFLAGGTFILRYTGTGMTYSGTTPTGGTFNQIEIVYNGNVLGKLTDLVDWTFADIANPSGVHVANYVGQQNTIRGGSGSDYLDGGNLADRFELSDGLYTLDGHDGDDIFIFAGTDFSVAIPPGKLHDIQGGNDNDTIAVTNNGLPQGGVNLSNSTIHSIERIQFITDAYLMLDADSFGTGKIASNAVVDAGTHLGFIVVGNSDTGTINLSGLNMVGEMVTQIEGSSGNNRLTGNANSTDYIFGGDGNDVLDGLGSTSLTEVDTLNGGNGNDTYIYRSSVSIVEDAGAGTGIDTVRSGISLSLATLANVERIMLTGTDDVDATGNSLANKLTGNSGDNTLSGQNGIDTLDGGRGLDTLNGGSQRDVFFFDVKDSRYNAVDIISDYEKGAVGTGDEIDFRMALSIGGSSAAATATRASIDAVTGIATFKAGSGTTLNDALRDIERSFTAATDGAGDLALFQVNGTGSYYAFMSDGVAGLSTSDVVVRISNVTAVGSIDLSGGDLTILT